MMSEQSIEKKAQEWLTAWKVGPVPTKAPALSRKELAAMIDHTALKPETTPEMLDRLCDEARDYGFASVCVNPANVAHCARALAGTGVPVCSVCGFPLGATISSVKSYEAQRAIKAGATEIDMVINVGALKSGDYGLVRADIAAVVDACRANDALTKVIFENVLLTDLEKVIAAMICVEVGADFVKTSTGFNTGGATVEDIALMRAVVGPGLGVKAAGGIRSYDTALAMIAAGASRIGASSSVQIVQGAGA